MKIDGIRTFPGSNIYSHRPVLVMRINLEDLAEKESIEFCGFNERLVELLPGLTKHHCSTMRPGGFIERLNEGTYFGHIIEHVAIELTGLCGIPVVHGKTRYAGEPGWYNIIVEYEAEQGVRHLLKLAVELVAALMENNDFPLDEALKSAEKIITRTELGPSTRSIVDAAARRNIPYRRIGEGSLVQLGYGIHRRYIQSAMTSETSAVGVDIASDKELTKNLLRDAGISVPQGLLIGCEHDAVPALAYIGPPVVVKPYNGYQGKGVSLNLTAPEHVERAYRIAKQYSSQVIVEQQLSGRDYRLLVINGRMAAASERLPAHVIGDGEHTIAELIETINEQPERGEGHEKPLTKISVDATMMEYLGRRGLSMEYRPRPGEIIYLRECANLSTGGSAKDVTDLVHPEIVAMCERAAHIIGLDICGIDLILDDIAEPMKEGNGIIEINAAPGLHMHLAPSAGESRDVGNEIIEMLYPYGSKPAEGIPYLDRQRRDSHYSFDRRINANRRFAGI